MKRTFLLFLVLFMSGCIEQKTTSAVPEIELQGTIHVMGNEPFTQLAIEVGNTSYCIVGDHVDELLEHQGETTSVVGHVVYGECRTGPNRTINVTGLG